MHFSAEEAQLLKKSLVKIRNCSEAPGIFYDHLFRVSPDAQSLFIGDLSRQGEKLIDAIAFIIEHINHWSESTAEIEEMGLRHVAYGVLPEHYVSAGEALDQMLSEVLAGDYTPETRSVWSKVYLELSTIMLRAIDSRKSVAVLEENGAI
ncbi:MAG: globin domain-containing protein [Bacteroidota bacterium]